jgi:HPt (histidine-containing phosphotransfer) domain-containing protein
MCSNIFTMDIKQLDHTHLQQYYGDMIDDTAEIFEAFLDETPLEFETVKADMAAGELNKAANRLHKICPAFFSVGLPALTTLAQQVENNLRDKNAYAADVMMQHLELELQLHMPALLQEYNRVKRNTA